jgi:hypothetical protein
VFCCCLFLDRSLPIRANTALKLMEQQKQSLKVAVVGAGIGTAHINP